MSYTVEIDLEPEFLRRLQAHLSTKQTYDGLTEDMTASVQRTHDEWIGRNCKGAHYVERPWKGMRYKFSFTVKEDAALFKLFQGGEQ